MFTGKDAYEMILSGASLVQIYTSLSYEGPPVVRKIKNELADILRYMYALGSCSAKLRSLCYLMAVEEPHPCRA